MVYKPASLSSGLYERAKLAIDFFPQLSKRDFWCNAMPDQLLGKRVECPVCSKIVSLKTLLYAHHCDKQPGRPTQNPTTREYRLFHRARIALVARMADNKALSAVDRQPSEETSSQ